ncbi:MAG: S9 family peptidase [Aquabacterium sp.]|nr:S9 family peptidase [Aquabacterium sp.]
MQLATFSTTPEVTRKRRAAPSFLAPSGGLMRSGRLEALKSTRLPRKPGAWLRGCVWLLLALASLLAGCAVAPTHASLQAANVLPPLLPVRSFVADLESSGGHQISPDGKHLLWAARIGLSQGLFVQNLATGKTRRFAVGGLGIWSSDSQRVLLHMDVGGDENTRLVALDLAADPPRLIDLTPFPGAKSHLLMQLQDSPDLLVVSNRRDARVFDLYRHVHATGALELVAQNPGDVAQWLADGSGRLIGRGRLQDGQWRVETPDGDNASWRERFQVDPLEALQLLQAATDGSFFWALSDRGRDKLALVKLGLDGVEQVVHADARVDLSDVLFSPRRHVPLAVSVDPGLQEWQALDPAFAPALARLKGSGPSRLWVTSISDDDDVIVAGLLQPDGGRQLLYRRSDDSLQTLATLSRSRWHARSPLPGTQPLQFKARDGLDLHAYLTMPVAPAGQRLPAVLYVHGGPWARDRHLGGNPMVDFLANRGYAVLQVNYRGSTGYGRSFRDAARGEFAGAMHTDLIDGLDHLVQRGIIDPQRVAIMGASYGGYASLVRMTFPPQRFACAISAVGVSDLAALLDEAPPYWAMNLPLWTRFVGDPADPAQRAQMRQRSPLYRAGDAAGPILLLHGAQDARVKLGQSQRMAQALRAAGKPVDLQVFDRAGHGFFRWQDRMRQFRLTEDFLARCLGGRSGGFDLFELGTWLP